MPPEFQKVFHATVKMKSSTKMFYGIRVESSRPAKTREPRLKLVLCSVLAWNTNLRCTTYYGLGWSLYNHISCQGQPCSWTMCLM